MGEVRIKHESEMPWGPWVENPGAYSNQAITDKRHSRLKYFTDQSQGPWFWFWEFPPGLGTHRHSHKANEVLYVQEGEIVFEGKVCGPGTLIYVEKGTEYGPFYAGPKGAKGMNIRAGDAPGMKLTKEKRKK